MYGCNNSILPILLLACCCGNDGVGGLFGGRSGGCDDILWLLVILCCCGGCGFGESCGRDNYGPGRC